MRDLLLYWREHNFSWPAALPNVWIGGTVCNQDEADRVVPAILATPAAHRWVSVEPMLSHVDLTRYPCSLGPEGAWMRGLDWVVAGCESINGRVGRPARREWFESLASQCLDADVPCFVKQMAENDDGSGKILKEPLRDRSFHRLPW